ncbi:MAG: response regulator transcription factor [Corynebacterium sp.]|nr:response regulator transcription factor [Corynebacterium sp.]
MRQRVGFVDDHPAMRLGLAALLSKTPDLQLVATSDSVRGLLQRAADLDVVLLDLILADGSTPAENIRALRSAGYPVLALTSGERPQLVREAGRSGVAGMVRKSEPADVILTQIRAVLRGEVAATPDWAAALDSDTRFVSARLTAREAEILELYASGETAERVAGELFISRETVVDALKSIRAKYADAVRPVRNKVVLFRRAVEDGILTLES